MSSERISTYKAFWPFYVSQHMHKRNRDLHFLGTTLVLVCLGLAILRSPWFAGAAVFCGYAFAWVGHLVFERNRPATWIYPFWSLAADFQMFAFMCLGRMDREVKRMAILASEAPG